MRPSYDRNHTKRIPACGTLLPLLCYLYYNIIVRYTPTIDTIYCYYCIGAPAELLLYMLGCVQYLQAVEIHARFVHEATENNPACPPKCL